MLLILVTLQLWVQSTFADDYADGGWRKVLTDCWLDRSCDRVMTCAHGGDWNVTYPYDSMPAFQKAWENGADAIKGDFRVSKDNVGMVMHSSPIEIYESFNCFQKKVEEMTAEECGQCQMEITNYTFISAPDLLKWADNTINVMFCVKEDADFPRAISTLLENDASDRAYLEIGVGALLNLESSQVNGWDKVYFTVQVGSHDDIERLLGASDMLLQRAFLFEFHDWEDWVGSLEEDIQLVESHGLRSFAATNANALTATVDNHLDIYHHGFDVAYTYNVENAVSARQQVNTENGISPAR